MRTVTNAGLDPEQDVRPFLEKPLELLREGGREPFDRNVLGASLFLICDEDQVPTLAKVKVAPKSELEARVTSTRRFAQ